MPGIIDIEVNGVFLDIEEPQIRLETVNSVFTTDFYQGDYSFPFELTMTPNNVKALGYVNQIDTDQVPKEYAATVYIFGIPERSGKLVVTRSRRESVSVVITGGINALKNASKKLSEVMPADYVLGNSPTEAYNRATLASQITDYSVYGFTFVPFSQPDFYDGKNTAFLGVCNRVNSVTGAILGNSTVTISNKYNLVPWVFVHFVLAQIFKAEDLNPTGSYWTDPELKTLLLTNNRALDARQTNYDSFLTVVNSTNYTATGQKIAFFTGPEGTYDNAYAWDAAGTQYVIKNAGKHNITVYLRVLLDSTATLKPPVLDGGSVRVIYNGGTVGGHGLNVAQSGYSGALTISVVINAGVGDINKTVYVEYVKSTGLWQNQTYAIIQPGSFFSVDIDLATAPSIPATVVRWKNHLPDWTVGEFLAEIKKLGVLFDFDYSANTAKMDAVNNLLVTNEIIDLTEYSEPGYELNMEDVGKGLKMRYQFPAGQGVVSETDSNLHQGEFATRSDFPAPGAEGSTAVSYQTNEIYQVAKNGTLDAAWELKGHYQPEYTIGNGEKVLDIKLAPVLMTLADNEGGTSQQNKALMPYFKGRGSSELFGLGVEPVVPRLVFFRGANQTGLSATPQGGVYPYAGTGTTGINANTVGKYDLRLDRANSLPRLFMQGIFEAVNTNPVLEKNLFLRPGVFFKLKGTAKVVVDFNVFVIKSISTTLTRKTAKAKAYLLKI